MRSFKAWGLPVLTGLVVLAAVLLPRQLSILRDRGELAAVHIESLSEEDLTVREIPLPEKLKLLWRAVQYPDLEVFSTSQPPSVTRSTGGGAGRRDIFSKRGDTCGLGCFTGRLRPGGTDLPGRKPGSLCALRRISICQYAVFAGLLCPSGQLLDRGG